MGRIALASLLALVMVAAGVGRAHAFGLIRDSETERLISDYAQPVMKAADQAKANIRIHLVNDPSFNAFVVDGQNMFIHTGAIMRSETPNQLIGVIAHETGHIAGGHLARLRQVAGRAQTAAIMLQILAGVLIGAGAAAGAGGDIGQAGSALLYGSQSALDRTIKSYQRVEEGAADQAALRYLRATQQSARGMLETFEYFADQQLASARFIDKYAATHPMPRERIAQLRELAVASPYFDRKDPPELQLRHDLVRAKLAGFLEPQSAYNRYPSADQSLPARYGRAIATYRSRGLDAALPLLDALIAERPDYPYFWEIKGQFMAEKGRAREALPVLRKAISLAPRDNLMRLTLAEAMLSTADRGLVDDAIEEARKAMVSEGRSARPYQVLMRAYNDQGNLAEAQLAAAHWYLYSGKLEDAKIQAERAKRAFPAGSRNWLLADDIVNAQAQGQ